MSKLIYAPAKKFRAEAWATIAKANEICEEYAAAGYNLTLRQLYYQFVARGLILNNQKSYKNLGNVLNEARLQGMIDWAHLVDRTRNPHIPARFADAEDFVRRAAENWFHTDWRKGQHEYVEVWVEKEALGDVVEQACATMDVNSLACRGYMSQSEQWNASQRLLRRIKAGQSVTIIHLGDHDPSGIDMSRDNEERLRNFLVYDLVRAGWSQANVLATVRNDFKFERIALNMDQVEEYDPPPNFAKITDSRANDYIERFGDESWELDALPPDVLDQLIRDAITDHTDVALFVRTRDAEQEYQSRIFDLLDNHGHELALDN